jgi:hypothetical protein
MISVILAIVTWEDRIRAAVRMCVKGCMGLYCFRVDNLQIIMLSTSVSFLSQRRVSADTRLSYHDRNNRDSFIIMPLFSLYDHIVTT